MASDKLSGSNDMEKLKDLSSRNYKSQAIWFLNCFWEEGSEERAEKLWQYVEKISKLDLQKGADGNSVDELIMHRFLEAFQETMTVREMRDTLRSKGAIGDNVKYISLAHYLIFRYEADFHVLVNAPQGDNRKELEEAQRLMDEVSKKFEEAEKKAQEARAALAKAKAEEAEAKKAEAEAKSEEEKAKASAEKARVAEAEAKTKEAESQARSAEAKVAQSELEAALAEVKAQEDAFNAKKDELTRKSEEGSVVQQNKAKNELAQHLASDPLPLRKAKITLEAAVKKAEKATKAAEEARIASEKASQESTKTRHASEEAARHASDARASAESAARRAESARASSEEADRQADAALREMQRGVQEAEAYLNEIKSRPGKAAGAIWWMERELHEKKKFMPVAKGGIGKQIAHNDA